MKKYILLLFLLLSMVPALAQNRKKTTPKKTNVNVKAETPGQKLYKEMLPATEKVMFIDSVVVDKSDFLSKIPLNAESGKLDLYSHMNTGEDPDATNAYLNELGTKCYYSSGDTIYGRHIYYTELIGNTWSEPQKIKELSRENTSPDYPFLLTDGVTLYFSAKGNGCLGGDDIFMTHYDTDNNQYYAPQNIGLPYNSKHNDYLLAIDDFDKLGWLVTDRRQPEGKVCIYTFVPNETRIGFDADNLTDTQLESYANIQSIRDTWKFGDRNAALKRLHDMKTRTANHQSRKQAEFVVNDQVTYHQESDFQSSEGRQLYEQYLTKKKVLSDLEANIDQQRAQWRKAQRNEKEQLATDIKKAEKNIEQLNADIHLLEKKIRNAEIQRLNK
jgi:hypothetical protein